MLKDFQGRRTQFVNELEAALSLHAACCNVPNILHVDFDALHIVYSYIDGPHIPGVNSVGHSKINIVRKALELLTLRHNSKAQTKETRRNTSGDIEVNEIGEGLRAIHRAGYTLEDISHKSVVIEEGTGIPVFTNLEHASHLPEASSSLSTYMRDKDAKKLNDRFGTELLTAAMLRKLRHIPGGAIYAPIYVGQGIRWGAVWNPDVGVGRLGIYLCRGIYLFRPAGVF